MEPEIKSPSIMESQVRFYGAVMGMTKQEIKNVKHKDYAVISQYKTES